MIRWHRRLWVLPVVMPLVMLVVVLVMARILRGGPPLARVTLATAMLIRGSGRSSPRESDVVLEALRQRLLGGEIARTSSSIRWTFCSDSTTRNDRE